MARITCPECGQKIDDFLLSCPNCGHATPKPTYKMKESEAIRNGNRNGCLLPLLAILISALLFGAMSWLINGMRTYNNGSQQPSSSNTSSSYISIKATKLIHDYDKDPVAADEFYVPKRLYISGTVTRIVPTESISFGNFKSDETYHIDCYFFEEDFPKLENLTVGDKVIVTGICNGAYAWTEYDDEFANQKFIVIGGCRFWNP